MLKFGFAGHLSGSHRSFVCASVFLDGGQFRRCKDVAEDVGRSLLGRSVGLRTTAQRLECSCLLLHYEGAFRSHKGGEIQAVCHC